MLRRSSMYVLLLIWALLIGLGCGISQQGDAPPDQSSLQDVPVVRIGESTYVVYMAVQQEERQQGLSGRESLGADEGMLFVFEEERQLNFWMKEMHFPLDIVWIDAQCQVVGVNEDVPTPPPNASNEEIPRVQSPSPARYVLEVNAGEAERNGLEAGDLVEFHGTIEGQHGC